MPFNISKKNVNLSKFSNLFALTLIIGGGILIANFTNFSTETNSSAAANGLWSDKDSVKWCAANLIRTGNVTSEKIDFQDLVSAAKNYKNGYVSAYTNGDVNGDYKVDILDIQAFSANLNRSLPSYINCNELGL